jgi:hypothetical protein
MVDAVSCSLDVYRRTPCRHPHTPLVWGELLLHGRLPAFPYLAVPPIPSFPKSVWPACCCPSASGLGGSSCSIGAFRRSRTWRCRRFPRFRSRFGPLSIPHPPLVWGGGSSCSIGAYLAFPNPAARSFPSRSAFSSLSASGLGAHTHLDGWGGLAPSAPIRRFRTGETFDSCLRSRSVPPSVSMRIRPLRACRRDFCRLLSAWFTYPGCRSLFPGAMSASRSALASRRRFQVEVASNLLLYLPSPGWSLWLPPRFDGALNSLLTEV